MPPNSDDGWAAVIALLILGGARLLDWALPKGWHFRWIERVGRKDEEIDDEP